MRHKTFIPTSPAQRRCAALLVPLLAVAAGCVRPELAIRFPNAAGNDVTFEPYGGWPLTLSLTVNEDRLLGLSTEAPPAKYPSGAHKGYILFDDPDGCPSWEAPWMQRAHYESVQEQGPLPGYFDCLTPPPPPWPRNETMVEIDPGLHLGGDDPPCQIGPLELLTFDPIGPDGAGTNTWRVTLGPCRRPAEGGYGFGPHPRLPGLVVLADAGLGVVTDEHFNPPEPAEARNLAGLFHSISYELKDRRGHTHIVAHMNAAGNIFEPVVLGDERTTDRCGEYEVLVRIDGGPETCRNGWPMISEHMVTVRAFMVNGRAPATLADVDGDGTIDLRDAEMSGLQLLSGQAELRFRQYLTTNTHQGLPFDFDGDGFALYPPVLPSGPVELTDPPR